MEDLAKTLSYNYVFRGLSRDIVAGFAAIANVKDFMGGDVLVRQFDYNSDVMILLEGQARIKSFAGDTLAEFGPGSIVGEISLIDEQPRSATVVAVGSVRAAVIPAAMFRGMMDSDPKTGSVILMNLCKVLCRRLRTMNVHVDTLAKDF
jgi:CRP/FNR family cyclic AMP-dependent transcriptional regulator